MIIRDSKDVLDICRQRKIPIYEVAIEYEIERSETSRQDILLKMHLTYDEMKKSIKSGLLKNDTKHLIKGKMFNDYGKKMESYNNTHKALSGNVAATAVSYALSVMEVNCSMGRVVASPTAGSCGVLPAVIMSVTQTLGLDDECAVKGLLTAGIIGVIIGKNASLSGAKGGCQAEIGSASAMAAAAVVEMAGGTPSMAFDAGAITLKNVMGLVCDPVAGLVEVPCVKRNGMGTMNALMCADMVLAGITSVIPFDEVVWAMNKVGNQMPVSLKETSDGGIAATPTGLRLKKEIMGE